jgi:small multidrug resistance pump
MRLSTLLLLALAIVSEVVATSALKASDGFTRLWPSLVMAVGYAVSFYCMSLAVRALPVGIVYAIWSGVGIVLISAAGWATFGEKLDLPAIVGLALIVAGVLVLNLLSETVRH